MLDRAELRVLSCSLLLALLVASCSSSNRLEDYSYYRLATNPTTLDPAHVVDVTGGLICAKLFNGLVRLDEKLTVIPDIAEEWAISKDRLTYTFSLRKGVRFSNGQEVTAKDFVQSFKRVMDPKRPSPNTWVFEKIAGSRDFIAGKADDVRGLRAIDDHTLEIVLDRPFAPFPYLLTMSAAYVVPEREVERLGPEFASHPVGSGPFVLAEWLPNRSLRLDRREDYFGVKAKVKGITYRVIPEDLTTMTEFELGNLDVISLPGPEFSRYMKDPKWRDLITAVQGINTYYMGLNCSRPPFDNRNLRRAVNLAIDRERLLALFYEQRGRIAGGPVPDTLRKWPSPPRYPYNPGKAREMVEKEGFKGRMVEFYVTADQEVVDMAEFIQSYLRKAGLDVRIRQLEWSAYKEALNKGEADMFWLSWWADYPHPEDFLFPLFHSANAGPLGNRVRYSNPAVDSLIELGQGAASDHDGSIYYERAERMIVDDAAWVFFWHKNDFILRQPWVKNYRQYPIYTMDKGTDVVIDGRMLKPDPVGR